MTDDSTRPGGAGQTPLPDDVDASELPIDVEDPTFESPWQARAFAVAVVLSDHREGVYSWTDFQENLVAEIRSEGTDAEAREIDGSESAYYRRWLRALERLVLEEELVEIDDVHDRVREFAGGDRDASEFVEGEHAHTHPHANEHGSG